MLPQKARLWFWVAVLALSFAGVGYARQVRVDLKDGRQISGRLIAETSSTVTIAIAGIETTFPREQVDQVEVERSLSERYRERRAEMADDDWAGRYELARWLYDHDTAEGYHLARRELIELLEDRPSHQQGQLLLRVVETRIEQERQQREQPAPEESATSPLGIEGRFGELLPPEDVALMKAFEVNLYERPTVVVPRPVIDEVFDRYRSDPVLQPFLGREGKARFLRLPGYEQLGILFDLRAREYYDQVIIRTEPTTLRRFRMGFHANYVVRYCGQCHGETGMQAPGLHLLTRRFSDEATAYTNLLILRRTQAGQYPLIYKDDPLRSPFLQYGLPRDAAVTPHPDVRGWRPYFTGLNDRRLEQMVRWIRNLYGDWNDYPIDYELPGDVEPSDSSFDTADAADGDA